MKHSTVIWLIAAAVLLVVGGVIFTVALAKCGWDFSALGGAQYEEKQMKIEEAFTSVSIETEIDDINIERASGNECTVVLRETEKLRHEAKVENGVLKITVEDTRSWIEKFGFFSGKRPKVTVYLPKKQYSALSISTTTGDLGVRLPEYDLEKLLISATTGDVFVNAAAREALSVSVSTGDIKLENASAQSINLALTTGKIELSGGNCGTLLLAQTTGRTNLRDFTCEALTSNATTGRIKLENVLVEKKLSIERTTGDITLKSCDASELYLKTTTGDVSGTLRTEKTFFTETSTGKVDVPKTLSNFSCEVHTTTGNIEFTIEP